MVLEMPDQTSKRSVFDFVARREASCRSVRREDLNSQSASSGLDNPDATIESHFHEQLERLFERDDATDQSTPKSRLQLTPKKACSESEEAYDFRLFAKSTRAADSKLEQRPSHDLNRIILRSSTPANSEPGFINPRRPEKYYFTGNINVDQLEQFRQAAVSGERILEGLKTKWPGSNLPWRVAIIRATKSRRSSSLESIEKSQSEKRKRNGKKRRIAIRKKIATQSAEELARRQSQAEREVADRERRTRKNREKKVKKKQKEKMKKSQSIQDAG